MASHRTGQAARSALPVADSCAVYARLSSKDQEREGFSIPAQIQLLRGYATNRNLTILKEFVDVDTAKHAGRTGCGEMFAFLRNDKTCRVLLVEKTDRLYRNLKDWVTLDELDLEMKVEVNPEKLWNGPFCAQGR